MVHSGYPFSIYDCTNLGATGYTCPRYVPGVPAGFGQCKRSTIFQAHRTCLTITCPCRGQLAYRGERQVLAVPDCTGLLWCRCSYSKTDRRLRPATNISLRDIGTLIS